MFQEYSDLWLKKRDKGETGVTDLNNSLKLLRTGKPYQKAKIAVILAMDPDKYRDQLNTLGFPVPATGTIKERKYQLFLAIYQAYRSLPDPRLIGKIEMQLGMNAQGQAATLKHFTEAENLFTRNVIAVIW